MLGTEKEVSDQQISNMPGFSETNFIGYGKNNTNNTKQGKTSKEFLKEKKITSANFSSTLSVQKYGITCYFKHVFSSHENRHL